MFDRESQPEPSETASGSLVASSASYCGATASCPQMTAAIVGWTMTLGLVEVWQSCAPWLVTMTASTPPLVAGLLFIAVAPLLVAVGWLLHQIMRLEPRPPAPTGRSEEDGYPFAQAVQCSQCASPLKAPCGDGSCESERPGRFVRLTEISNPEAGIHLCGDCRWQCDLSSDQSMAWQPYPTTKE